ncbi:hypothetical protein [Acinetobacter sp. ANC 3813]|uniref:hypothetical protein n=1 Tax=Acinetobacter sp. ANC 3813 TaxID=1977873 RepID=UPI000A348F06|nr:hypothetical protein [Acinetobacter sp. ANC 3813]OTG88892.1 hypothetical protein B9T34_14105 [Acinetobacter sp. ANC 3813]
MNTPSISASLVMLQALANYLDRGSSNAALIFYSSNKPTALDFIPDPASKLLTLNFPEPCFKSITETSIELQPSQAGTVIQAGLAKWARLFNGEGHAVVDVSMETDIVLDTYDFAIGATVKLDSIFLSSAT